VVVVEAAEEAAGAVQTCQVAVAAVVAGAAEVEAEVEVEVEAEALLHFQQHQVVLGRCLLPFGHV
jgi:hypothetical protein